MFGAWRHTSPSMVPVRGRKEASVATAEAKEEVYMRQDSLTLTPYLFQPQGPRGLWDLPG